MKRPAALVVAAWGLGNALLATLLAGFGGEVFEVATFFSSAGLALLVAAAVMVHHRYRLRQRSWRQPEHGDIALLVAAGVLLASLGFAFGWWMTAIAVVPLFFAVVRTISVRRGGIW